MYGGSDGVLDRSGLESAVAQPRASFGGRHLHGDVWEMAAVYLVHLARNHPFADGNKRVAAVAAIVFLTLNGHEFDAEPDDLERVVFAVATGDMSREAAAVFFREHCS